MFCMVALLQFTSLHSLVAPLFLPQYHRRLHPGCVAPPLSQCAYLSAFDNSGCKSSSLVFMCVCVCNHLKTGNDSASIILDLNWRQNQCVRQKWIWWKYTVNVYFRLIKCRTLSPPHSVRVFADSVVLYLVNVNQMRRAFSMAFHYSVA